MPWLLRPFMHIVPYLLQVSHAYYNLISSCLVALVPYTFCAFEFFRYLRFFLAGTTDNAHDYQLLKNVTTFFFFFFFFWRDMIFENGSTYVNLTPSIDQPAFVINNLNTLYLLKDREKRID